MKYGIAITALVAGGVGWGAARLVHRDRAVKGGASVAQLGTAGRIASEMRGEDVQAGQARGALPAARRVLVRVPTPCSCDGDSEGAGAGGAETSPWPPDVPETFRPEAFSEALGEAAASASLELDYAVDCSRFPCLIVTEPAPGTLDRGAALKEWLPELRKSLGAFNVDIRMGRGRDVLVLTPVGTPKEVQKDAADRAKVYTEKDE